ncbi:hypothetical protein OCGS_2175 [Oceaniovalibus guishaninsula JLT2003]|uniref:Uncharacterized protein n=1 Tax=Oceaniovalibus guishaninsula JLT2003 TaxID=1231392 RepID=K2GM83_9RHOB|nr:hypothetical protein [Oceaniovalibus guishaninsula]EKE43841.1 hypothetical protein OCGS_2175 [Oceaniovalibus guishaninsula JLT2003]
MRISHLPKGRTLTGQDSADIVTWQADPGAFMAIIAASDLHLGYDSAGQHIAAALGVPTFCAFVMAGGARHADRWTPAGPGPVGVLRLAVGSSEQAATGPAIRAVRALLRRAGKDGSAP